MVQTVSHHQTEFASSRSDSQRWRRNRKVNSQMLTENPNEGTPSEHQTVANIVPFRVVVVAPPAALKNKTSSIVRKLEDAYSRTRANLLTRIEHEFELGEIWKDVKAHVIPKSGLTVEQWVKTYLTFSHQYANRCAQLTVRYAEFEEAHGWYAQSGANDGWRTKKATGVDYALEVIALHKRAKAGEAPDSADKTEKAARSASKDRVAKVERDLAAERKAKTQLVAELERVVGLYRATEPGRHFTSEVLNSVTASPQEAGEEAPQTDESPDNPTPEDEIISGSDDAPTTRSLGMAT